MKLYSVLIPINNPKGYSWSCKLYSEMITTVCAIAGGVTIDRKRNDGAFLDKNGNVVKDTTISILVATTPEKILEVVEFIKQHYQQSAVFYYVKSEEAYVHF